MRQQLAAAHSDWLHPVFNARCGRCMIVCLTKSFVTLQFAHILTSSSSIWAHC